MIKIVYSNTKTYNGIKMYSLNLYSDLKKELDVKLKPLPRIEIKLNGKKYGGWTSQRFLAWTAGNADIVHSASHWDLAPHTNVVTIQDLFPLTLEVYREYTTDSRRRYNMRFLKIINEKRIKVIVPNPMIADEVRKFISNADITVIPSKIFVQLPTANPYPEDNKLHLLTIGEIHGDQPNRKLIYELYDWIKGLDNIDLYHIGKITDSKCLNYANNIHQLGQVDPQTKFNYLAYADKYVFKTLGEGQGYPVMEAMKLGTQPVINDLPEHRFFLGDYPYYYHNKDEFLEMIYKPKKTGLAEQISQYDNWIEKYKKVYEEVMG